MPKGQTRVGLKARPVHVLAALARASIATMPACDARYDAILSDGHGSWDGWGRRATTAVLDFTEERLPDDFGDPGALLSARLDRYWTDTGKRIRYAPVGVRNRMTLWADGKPCRAMAKHRRYLRWQETEPDPPPHDDPDWIVPP